MEWFRSTFWIFSFKFKADSIFIYLFNFSIKSMMFMNIFVVLNGVIFVISKSIKSYETLLVGRFMSGFIR